MKMAASFLLFPLAIGLACQQNPVNEMSKINTEESKSIQMIQAFQKLAFTRPVDLQSPKDCTNIVFVVEQEGLISVFENNTNVTNKSVFLDIKSKVDDNDN